MLEAAHSRQKDRVDVVVGWVETHGRVETEALLEGTGNSSPSRDGISGRDVPFYDLDLALARRPTLILMDELADTNAQGSRHPKRWQDVLELLNALASTFIRQ